MIFRETALADARIVELEEQRDERGSFARIWCQREFEQHGLAGRPVQASLSVTAARGTVRGLHYQAAPSREAKLVRCLRGAIRDVIVDLRPDSPSFKRHLSLELSAANRRALYVPAGFAHGFQTLSDDVELLYQMSDFYDAGAARGLRWNDPAFDVQWPLPVSLIADRDRQWPDFDPAEVEGFRGYRG